MPLPDRHTAVRIKRSFDPMDLILGSRLKSEMSSCRHLVVTCIIAAVFLLRPLSYKFYSCSANFSDRTSAASHAQTTGRSMAVYICNLAKSSTSKYELILYKFSIFHGHCMKIFTGSPISTCRTRRKEGSERERGNNRSLLMSSEPYLATKFSRYPGTHVALQVLLLCEGTGNLASKIIYI
eukprot:SAG31_NODE_1641_length_7664_cov_3.789954_5_plen_181_part_00